MSGVPGIVRGRNEDLDRLGGMVGGLGLTVPRLYVLAFGGVNAFMHCWSRTGGLTGFKKPSVASNSGSASCVVTLIVVRLCLVHLQSFVDILRFDSLDVFADLFHDFDCNLLSSPFVSFL